MGFDDQKIQNQFEDSSSKGTYGAMPTGYSVRPPGYGAMPSGYTIPPPGYGAMPSGYTIPPPGYGAPPPGYGASVNGPYSAPPPTYGAPLQGPYVAPWPIYVAPPPTCPCMRNGQCHTQNPHPKKTESSCEQFFTECCGALLFCCIIGAIF